METMAMCLDKLYKNYIKPQNMCIPEWVLGKVTVSVVEALRYLKNEHVCFIPFLPISYPQSFRKLFIEM